jgi:hypothetical protein
MATHLHPSAATEMGTDSATCKSRMHVLRPIAWLVLAGSVAAGSVMGSSYLATTVSPASAHMLSDRGSPTVPCGTCGH